MHLDFTIYYLFTFHVALLIIKIWACYSIAKMIVFQQSPETERYMIVFKPFEISIILMSFFMMLFEIYFMINFFVDIELYLYEYMSIADQIFFTILAVLYIKKEVTINGKRKN